MPAEPHRDGESPVGPAAAVWARTVTCAERLVNAVPELGDTLACHSHETRLIVATNLRLWWKNWSRVLHASAMRVASDACDAALAEGWTLRDIGMTTGLKFQTVHRRWRSWALWIDVQAPTQDEVNMWVRELVLSTSESSTAEPDTACRTLGDTTGY